MQDKSKQKPGKQNPLWIFGAAAAFLLAKGKTLLALLKFGKVGSAFVSMIISAGAYAIFFPWQFAIGLVLLIFVHELGHVIASRLKGIPSTGIMFVPFLGAMTTMKRSPKDAATEAFISIAGPLVGGLGALIVFAAAYVMDSKLLYAISYFGFFLNAINLLPMNPLDGGKIAAVVTRWLWLVGLIAGLVIIIYWQMLLFLILWLFFAYDLYKKFIKHRQKVEERSVAASFLIAAEPLIAQGFLIPGTEHKRDLDYSTYSDLEGQQYVRVVWEGLDFTGTIPLMQQGLIRRARLTGLDRVQKEDGLHLMLHCQVDYTIHEDDKYYDVSPATRWQYGIAYTFLAGALIGMMVLIHKLSGITM